MLFRRTFSFCIKFKVVPVDFQQENVRNASKALRSILQNLLRVNTNASILREAFYHKLSTNNSENFVVVYVA
jgi:hypothetical protein